MNPGKLLIAAGLFLVILGVIVSCMGRFPGNLVWRGKHTTVYFPWLACLLLSVLGTLLLWFFNRNR